MLKIYQKYLNFNKVLKVFVYYRPDIGYISGIHLLV